MKDIRNISIAVVLLLLQYYSLRGQSSLAEMNDRAVESFSLYEIQHVSGLQPAQRLLYASSQSIYQNSSGRAMDQHLKSLKDPEITKLLNKAEVNRKLEFAAFAALPLGILASGLVRQSGTSSLLKPAGISILAISLSCIIISPVANHRKNANYKEAVKRYNQRF
ncbi:MAG: hypothetical protein K0Q95_490 [Bacteroidota bacterium]|jgi:hypothetical protein|nr:hypothetical protein [Bacteroidota bacterium]